MCECAIINNTYALEAMTMGEKGKNILKIKLLKIWALLATGVLYTLILTVCRLLAIQYIISAKVMIYFIGLMMAVMFTP